MKQGDYHVRAGGGERHIRVFDVQEGHPLADHHCVRCGKQFRLGQQVGLVPKEVPETYETVEAWVVHVGCLSADECADVEGREDE